MEILTRFWWLLCAHALTDYVLQPEWMGRHKGAFLELPHHSYGPWWWSMAAHSLVNAAGVLYVTQRLWPSVGEFVVHFLLDTLKQQGKISATEDQTGHLLSKLIWSIWV